MPNERAPKLERKHDRLALVGFCSPHREWVPYEDQDLEVWGLNRGYIFQQRADKWWEMHGRSIWEWQQRRPGNHVLFLQGKRSPGQEGNFPLDMPILMHDAIPAMFPTSVTYPLLEVAEDIGSNNFRFAPDNADPKKFGENRSQTAVPYLGSTIAQQIALAIHMGYKEISLYGIDLNTSSEYAWQKPGVEHMLGLAAGRGIKIAIPDMCPLLKSGIYGTGYKRPEGEAVTPEQWQERINAIMDDRERLSHQLYMAQGAQGAIEWVLQQMLPGLDHELTDKRHNDIKRAIANLDAQLQQCGGALNETLHWAHITPEGQPADVAIRELLLAKEQETGQADGPFEGSIETLLMDSQSSSGGISKVIESAIEKGNFRDLPTNGHSHEELPKRRGRPRKEVPV